MQCIDERSVFDQCCIVAYIGFFQLFYDCILISQVFIRIFKYGVMYIVCFVLLQPTNWELTFRITQLK